MPVLGPLGITIKVVIAKYPLRGKIALVENTCCENEVRRYRAEGREVTTCVHVWDDEDLPWGIVENGSQLNRIGDNRDGEYDNELWWLHGMWKVQKDQVWGKDEFGFEHADFW